MRIPTGGRLLDKIAYCMRKPCKATNIIDEEIEVRDTFPYNPDSKTSPETARMWGTRQRWGSDEVQHPDIIVRDNDPFGITITDLHVRSEGGRAYKVIDSEMRRFDLREDQVLEVMKLVGIQPKGAVPAKFVWGILGSQIRLVLVGGELHTSMVEGANDKKEFELAQKSGLTPTEGSLKAGHVYRKKDKSLHLFLGRVKRPGVDKTQFAFMSMPDLDVKLEDDYSSADEVYKKWKRKEHELHLKWSALTWRERCQWKWIDKWATLYEERLQGNPYVSYPHIVFMASPKFEADVSEVEADFFEELKSNKDLNHSYQTSTSWRDLCEEWKFGKGGRPYTSPGYDWRTPREEQERRHREFEEKQKRAYNETRTEYRDALIWVTPSK